MFEDLIRTYAWQLGIPEGLIAALIKHESNFDPQARGSGGEYGLMQIFCSTARQMGFTGNCEDLRKPGPNILYGSKYLAWQYARYGAWLDAIAAYNAGSVFKNKEGKYTNSKGVPNVQKYVDSVVNKVSFYDPDLYSKLTNEIKKKFAITTGLAQPGGLEKVALILLMVLLAILI